MAGFDLLSLYPTLLEQVINKMEGKSYFRLQQTCRDMKEFIHTNRHISVYADESFSLEYNTDSCSWKFGIHENPPIIGKYDPGYRYNVDIEVLYGTRLKRVGLRDLKKDFDTLCTSLVKSRITCEDLNIRSWGDSNEVLETVLEIVKPTRAGLDIRESNGYEALLRSKTLKGVCVRMKPSDIAVVVPKLLLRFAKVGIGLGSYSVKLDTYRQFLEILYSQPWPGLRKFDIHTTWRTYDAPSDEELAEEFSGFNFTAKEDEKSEYTIYVMMELPQQFPPGSTCKLTFETGGWADAWLIYQCDESL